MIKMPGKNNFINNIFDYWEWSAPVLHKPSELRDCLDKLDIVGKEIYNIKVLGQSLFHSTNFVESHAYEELKHLPENERQRLSQYMNIPNEVMYPTIATIDSALLIMLDDGSVLAFEMFAYSKVRMGVNEIPWDIQTKYNDINVDLGDLFFFCVCEKISDIEIVETPSNGELLYDTEGNPLEPQDSFIEGVYIHLDNGYKLGISMNSDRCEVYCVDAMTNELQEISFDQLQECLHNEEDKLMGKNYKPLCKDVYFGRNTERTDIYSIVPNGNRTKMLSVCEADYGIINLALLFVVADYDNYSDYLLKYEKWQKVLRVAEDIMYGGDFGQIVKYLHETARMPGAPRISEDMQPIVEQMIMDVLERKEFYRKQVSELKRFTKSCIKEYYVINIWGL